MAIDYAMDSVSTQEITGNSVIIFMYTSLQKHVIITQYNNVTILVLLSASTIIKYNYSY